MNKGNTNYRNGEGLKKLVEYVETAKLSGKNFNIKYEFGENSMNIEITLLDKKTVKDLSEILTKKKN